MSSVDANPCPKCKAKCHLMAGINLPGNRKADRMYLTCWACGISKDIAPGSDWQPLAKAARELIREKDSTPKPKNKRVLRNMAAANPAGWTQHTPYHWSRYIDGKKLDYWPSKRKWMFNGKVEVGNIDEFMSKRRDTP